MPGPSHGMQDVATWRTAPRQPFTRQRCATEKRLSRASPPNTTGLPTDASSRWWRPAVLVWAVAGGPHIPAFWLIVPAAVFVALAVGHARLLRRRDEARRAVEFYARGLARIEDRWEGLGPEGLAFLPEDHPYAADLDLFGAGSIFQLLSTARLGGGERMLANWLLSAASPDQVRARQAAVDELRARLDLRERLALVGAEIAGFLDTTQLAAWGQAPARLTGCGRELSPPSWPSQTPPACAPLFSLMPERDGSPHLPCCRQVSRCGGVLRCRACSRRRMHRFITSIFLPRCWRSSKAKRARRRSSARSGRRLTTTGEPASVRIHQLRRLDGSPVVAAQPVLRTGCRHPVVGHAIRVGDRSVAAAERTARRRLGRRRERIRGVVLAVRLRVRAPWRSVSGNRGG